jgi:protease II
MTSGGVNNRSTLTNLVDSSQWYDTERQCCLLHISKRDCHSNNHGSSSNSEKEGKSGSPPNSDKRDTQASASSQGKEQHRYHSSTSSSNDSNFLAAILAREKANFMSQSFINRPQQQQQQHVYRQVYQEICQASRQNQQHLLQQLPAEPGPTGKYMYRWRMNVVETGATKSSAADDSSSSSSGERIQRRVYVRQPSSSSYETEQVVIVLDDPDIQNNSMSLAVDETMIAYNVTCRAPPTRKKQDDDDDDDETSSSNDNHFVVVRLIDSQQEFRIPTTNHKGRILSVEFGPKTATIVHHDNNTETSTLSTTSHVLYWLQANAPDDPHRPTTVYTCNVILQHVQHDDDDNDDKTTRLTCSTPHVVYSATDDPTIHVHLQRTKGCRYMAIHAQTLNSNEIYLVGPPLEDEEPSLPQLLLVRARQPGCMYHVDVGEDGDVFIVGNMSTSPSTTTTCREGQDVTAVWQTCIDQLPLTEQYDNRLSLARTSSSNSSGDDDADSSGDGHDYAIVDLDLFHDFYALYQVSTLDGSPRIQICSRTIPGQKKWIVPLQLQDQPQEQKSMAVVGPVSVLCPTGNLYYHAKSIRFFVDCPVQPRAVYEYNVVSHRLQQLSGGTTNQRKGYIQERMTVPSRDGTLVPMSLVYHKSEMTATDRPKSVSSHNDPNNNDKTPIVVILIGYGAYGKSVDVSYNPGLQPLLDRGFVLAYAHVRGGGELGSQWHDQGRGPDKKSRGIEDYLACAKAIQKYSFTGEDSSPPPTGQGHVQQQRRRPVHILAKAFSAGGVVVGGAVNREPQLFDTVILTNAFLNVYETLMDPTLSLTQHEWDEYGNPYQSTTTAAAIQSYCPVTSIPSATPEHQLRRDDVKKNVAPWPRVLLIAALNDTQVPFYNNTLAYGTKLRQETLANVAIHILPDGGHDLDHNREHVAAIEACFMIDLATTTTTNRGSPDQ